MSVIKIKPSHPSQGAYVIIEESDFNPAIHERFDAPEQPDAPVEDTRKPAVRPKSEK